MIDFGQESLPTIDATLYEAQCAVVGSLETLQETISVDYTDYSTESLGAVIGRIRSAHATFTSRIHNLFTIGQKRYTTEYATWMKKHGRDVAAVERMTYEDACEHDVDYPTGMKMSYPECMKLIDGIMGKYDIHAVVKNATELMDAILASIAQGSDRCESKLASSHAKLEALLKPVLDMHATLLDGFDGDVHSMDQIAFGKMFANMDELKQFRETLGVANERLSALRQIRKTLDVLEQRVDSVVNYLLDTEGRTEDDYQPSSKFTKQFAQYITSVDGAISMYGDTSLRLMALTHNTTFVYQTLRGK